MKPMALHDMYLGACETLQSLDCHIRITASNLSVGERTEV